MKLAIVGSRSIDNIELDLYVSEQVDEIVTGGAVGVDTCAAEYARKRGIKLTLFLPQYELYGRAAPIVRNQSIVEYADQVLIFWDGGSKGTLSVMKYAHKIGKAYTVIRL